MNGETPNIVPLSVCPTCKDCKHWVKMATTISTLGKPPVGECRERKHLLPIPTKAGIGGAATFLRVGEGDPICGQFAARIEA